MGTAGRSLILAGGRVPKLDPRAIIVYCSATRWGQWDSPDCTAGHFVIGNGYATPDRVYRRINDGKIWQIRHLHQRGQHCRPGYMNNISFGICLVGIPGWPVPDTLSAPPDTCTARPLHPWITHRQWKSLRALLIRLCNEYTLNPVGLFIPPGGKKCHKGRQFPVISQISQFDASAPASCGLSMESLRANVALRCAVKPGDAIARVVQKQRAEREAKKEAPAG